MSRMPVSNPGGRLPSPFLPVAVGDAVVSGAVPGPVVAGELSKGPGDDPELRVCPRSPVARSPVPSRPEAIVPASSVEEDLG